MSVTARIDERGESSYYGEPQHDTATYDARPRYGDPQHATDEWEPGGVERLGYEDSHWDDESDGSPHCGATDDDRRPTEDQRTPLSTSAGAVEMLA